MRIIKFDTLYPQNFLAEKVIENLNDINKMSFEEYHNWLISLRLNFSDFYTYNLNKYGWESSEFFLDNDLYLKKCGTHYWGYGYYLRKAIHRLRNMLGNNSTPFVEKILLKHIVTINPDVIFIREQVFIRSKFWERFRNDKLVVSRMDCGIPKDWSPLSFDMIYTNIPSYSAFFKSNNIQTLSNANGFDIRILEKITSAGKVFDVVYVGGLGTIHGFQEKTIFLEELVKELNGAVNFKWWGYRTEEFSGSYPFLDKKYSGLCGGLEMLNIYAESKIVVNNYGSGIGNVAVNQRIYEVMGVGTLLLTKESETLQGWGDYLVTYSDVEDCVRKIKYYLSHESERERIAQAGQEFVLRNYNYQDLMAKLSGELKQAYHDKFLQTEKVV